MNLWQALRLECACDLERARKQTPSHRFRTTLRYRMRGKLRERFGLSLKESQNFPTHRQDMSNDAFTVMLPIGKRQCVS